MNEMVNVINEYITPELKSPYSDWLNNLKDKKGKAKVISFVDRMELGNFSSSKSLGDGVLEIKIDYGPGYRIYYAREGKNIYLLLCAGDKTSQKKDIKLAKKYWKEHKEMSGGKNG